jgi:hypothetical protein
VSVRQGDAIAPGRAGPDDFAATGEAHPADLTVGLASLRFMGTALRRRAWVWCAAALGGLVIGLGLLVVVPPAYQASASVLLTNDPNLDPGDASQTSLVLAQTRSVAQAARDRLGLRQSVTSFQASYMVTILTDRILLITASGPSSGQAVARANAVATAFLRFRANALQIERQNVLGTLEPKIAQTSQQVKSITEQVTSLAAQPGSTEQVAKLHALQDQQYKDAVALVGLQRTAATYPVITTAMVASSVVLDAAVPLHRGHQTVLFYPIGGLFLGLMFGLSTVIIVALGSGRLYRRDDVAHALGAPVNLSVGRIPAYRWLPGRLRLAAARGPQTRRIVAYLRRAVPTSSPPAALAAVGVDNARAVALPLVCLAMSLARAGRRVVVADLAGGAPAARLLGVGKPGVREVSVRGVRLVVAVPGRDDVVPVGPLPSPSAAPPGSAAQAVTSAYESADVLLTLVTVDPALGAEHVPTWADHVVVVVTAGCSSPAKIHAVGEMVWLSGAPQRSAVLIGADKADVSLGVTWASSRQPQPAQLAGISR